MAPRTAKSSARKAVSKKKAAAKGKRAPAARRGATSAKKRPTKKKASPKKKAAPKSTAKVAKKKAVSGASSGRATKRVTRKRAAAAPAPARTRKRPSKTGAAAKGRSSKKRTGRARTAKRPERMKPSDRRRFRSLLMDRHRELTQAYAISKGDSRDRLDDGTEDYIDYAVSSYAREFLLSLSELDRKQLMLVEEALKRVTRSDYGLCQQCGKTIARKRLEVAPWAQNCLRCQELEEQGILPDREFPAGAEPSGAEIVDIEIDDDDDEGAYDPDLEESDDEVESDEAI